tara:strand:- start:6012 stop:6941 length:930 start_codon:yes stop_codon:yes gene_type:complete
MKLLKPKFWDYKKKSLLSLILYPLTLITKSINLFKPKKNFSISNLKTICVGNIYLGGTGKTPLAIKINILLNSKFKSVIIKKEYSDQIDEQKLLDLNSNLICNKKRILALKKAKERNFDLAIFDDGLQDKSVNYNLSIVCFNNQVGIGNGLLLPAGPLRENLENLENYDAVFLNGDEKNEELINILKKFNNNIEIFEGFYVVENVEKFVGNKKYLAFSGIGNPISFENTLKKYKIQIEEKIFFPDHYNYSDKDIYNIQKKASVNSLKIITTEKDFLRLNEKQQKNIEYLKINLEIKDEKKFVKYLIDKL